MTRDIDLLVVGEINPDLVLRSSDVTPAFGQQEKLVDEARLTVGSSSAITACGAARLGLRTAFVGRAGDDPFGRFMLEAMAQRGIDVSSCALDPSLNTGVSVILSSATGNGDRAILTYLGAISELRSGQIDRSLLPRARHLHVGSYFLQRELQSGLAELFRDAHEYGVSTSLDTNWDPNESWDSHLRNAMEVCDILLPNEAEALALTKCGELDDSLARLAELVPLVAVKLGADGGVARSGNEVTRSPGFPVEVVDTTGAGDSFNAGFLYGHLKGWSLERSLLMACACGSLSTRRAGGTEGQPTSDEAHSAMEALG